MAYGIILRSQRTIDVDSELGKGTTFSIRLRSETNASTESELAQNTTSSPLHILAVDDNSAALGTLGRMLRTLGHTVDLATGGIQGLEKFREGNYDLVVTDRAMPDMNGDQMTSAIKELSASQRVIMLTGLGDMMGTVDTPQGVDLVLGKPVTMSILTAGIAEYRPRPVKNRRGWGSKAAHLVR